MISGVGTDILETSRMEKSLQNPAFFSQAFTLCEREYIEKHPQKSACAAGIFCAKEACVKALGCGFSSLRPENIEIRHTEKGQPFPVFSKDVNGLVFFLSISHTKEYAVAFALCEKGCEDV